MKPKPFCLSCRRVGSCLRLGVVDNDRLASTEEGATRLEEIFLPAGNVRPSARDTAAAMMRTLEYLQQSMHHKY